MKAKKRIILSPPREPDARLIPVTPQTRLYAPEEYLDCLRNFNRQIHGSVAVVLWGLCSLACWLVCPMPLSLLLGILTVFPGLLRLHQQLKKRALLPDADRCWAEDGHREMLEKLHGRPLKIIVFLLMPALTAAFFCLWAYKCQAGTEYLFLSLLPLLFLAFALCWLLIVAPGIHQLSRLLAVQEPARSAALKAQWERQTPPFVSPLPHYDDSWIARNVRSTGSRGGSPQGTAWIIFHITNFLWNL